MEFETTIAGNVRILVRPVADSKGGIVKAAELYHQQWLPVHRNEFIMNGHRGNAEKFSRRKSLESQEWLAEEFPDIQLAAYLDDGKTMAGKINAIAKRLDGYEELPDDWDKLVMYNNDPKGNVVHPISIVVDERYRKLYIGRILVKALYGAAKGRYEHMGTLSTILNCPNDERLEDYYNRLHLEGRHDIVRAFHLSCGAHPGRLIDGDMKPADGFRKRARHGFGITIFEYF